MRRCMAWLLCMLLVLPGAQALAEAEPTPTIQPYGEAVDGTIRVLLQSLGATSALGMTLDGVFSVDGDRGFQFEKGTEIKLGLSGGDILLKAGGVIIDMGGGFTLVRHLDEEGNAGGAYIHESQKDTLYCGDIAVSVRNESLQVIITMHIEDYLLGVLPYEMSDTFPLEALKAQAVAARSYAMQRKARNQAQSYDVVDTANDQVFKGLDERYTRPIQAVEETRGVVGRTETGYAELFYSASNGGQTALASDVWGRDGDFGYLDIREDPYDVENPDSVEKRATVPKDATQMSEALYGPLVNLAGQQLFAAGELKQGEAIGLAEVVNVEAISPLYGGGSRQYGTIRFSVKANIRRLIAGEGTEEPTLGEIETLETPLTLDLSFYDVVRSALGISINSSKYDLIEVSETDTGFTFINRRYGHGVGLSQRGAEWMAGTYGMDYLEILSFYYPGLNLVRMDWSVTPLVRADDLPESLGYAAPRPTAAPTPAPLPALEGSEYYAVVTVEGVDQTLNVRAEPSLEAEILGMLRNGSRLIVESETGDGWAKMKTVEMEGYVSMDFIAKEVNTPAATDTPPGAANAQDSEQGKEESTFVF